VGEAKRKRQAAAEAAATLATRLTDDIKRDIVEVVRSTTLIVPNGGTCKFRADVGAVVLILLKVPCFLRYGSMLYRAGPDEIRDCLSFCGRGNRAMFSGNDLGGTGFLGHFWLRVGDDLVDFSLGDWVRECEHMVEVEEQTTGKSLGPVQWTAPVPDYLWRPYSELTTPWRSDSTPELGEYWYQDGVRVHPNQKHLIEVFYEPGPFIQIFLAGVKEMISELRLVERINAH
jgi:hypothetical protein